MKTLRLMMLGLLTAGSLQAQYFQHVYGGGSQDFLQTGVNVSVGPMGYLSAGYTDQLLPGGQYSVMVLRTDVNGNVGAVPTFTNGYQLADVTGAVVSAKGRKMVQHPSGRILVFGDYGPQPGGPSNGFFYMMVAPNGGAGIVTGYTLPFPVQNVRATSIALSPTNTNNVYVCGYVTDGSGNDLPIVMSLQFGTGAINWACVYNQTVTTFSQWHANDLVESPYPSSAGTIDVAIVGSYNTSSALTADGCFFTVNANTGAPTSPGGLELYGNAGSDDGLNSICIANNTVGSGAGFAVAGYTFDAFTAPASYETWAMKISANGAVVDWTSELMHAGLVADNFGYDIIERYNSFFQYEYYVGATVIAGGGMGADDALVYKVDANGNPAPGNNQFEYGGPGNENAFELDQYNGTPNDGLTIYGNTRGSFAAIGANDFYLVRAYFNGVTTCNSNLQPTPYIPGPNLLPPVPIAIIAPLNPSPMFYNMIFRLKNATICFAAAVGGGSNAKIAAGQNGTTSVFPNPVDHNAAQLTVAFDQPAKAGEAQVELWNMLGQLCTKQQSAVAEGQQELKLDFGTLKPGVYHLVVRRDGAVTDMQVTVQ